MEESSPYLGLRRWEDLDANILKKIFSRLPVHYIINTVSSVCYSWFLGCWDALFWSQTTLDFSDVMHVLECVDSRTKKVPLQSRSLAPGNLSLDKQINIKFTKMLKIIMGSEKAYESYLEPWRLSVKDILIPAGLDISDDHLLFIAKRTPNVESLNLFGSSSITEGGFARAIHEWKKIKHINMGQVSDLYCIKMLDEIGKNCPELVTLHMNIPRLPQHINLTPAKRWMISNFQVEEEEEEVTESMKRSLPQVKDDILYLPENIVQQATERSLHQVKLLKFTGSFSLVYRNGV